MLTAGNANRLGNNIKEDAHMQQDDNIRDGIINPHACKVHGISLAV